MEALTSPVELHGTYGDVAESGAWSPGARRNIAHKVVDGDRSALTHLREEHDYLIHRGDLADVMRLTTRVPPRGLKSTLQIELGISDVDAGVSLNLCVLEYDATGAKISVAFFEGGKITFHNLNPSCTTFLVGIRMQGVGSCTIDRVVVRSHEMPPPASVEAVQEIAERNRYLLAKAIRDIPGSSSRDPAMGGGSEDGGGKASDENLAHVLQEVLSIANPGDTTARAATYHRKRPFRVAIVSDIYMLNFYKDAFEAVDYLTPSNCDACLEANDYDIFLYVTSWRGALGNEWQGIKFREEPKGALDRILQRFDDRGKPTVFQSIEDPSNFEYFLPVAVKFKHVFTSDVDCIERYRNELGHDRVHYLSYGANPHLNNPIGAFRPTVNAAFFAGSYPKRYPERCADMNTIFGSIVDSDVPLVIADRNYGDANYAYPSRYRRSTIPPLRHDILQQTHKKFRFNINFNSIKTSPTMCAMRVYELQAQGSAIISNYATSVYNTFPNIRLVPIAQNLTDLAQDPSKREIAERLDGVRAIMTDRTAYDVIDDMLGKMGVSSVADFARVLVVADDPTSVKGKFDSQTYDDAELMALSSFGSLDELDRYCEEHRIRYLAVWDAHEKYEPTYLQDRVNVFKFAECSYVTQHHQADQYDPTVDLVHEYTNTIGKVAQTVFSLDAAKASECIGIAEGQPLPNGYNSDPLSIDFPIGRRFSPTSLDPCAQERPYQEPRLSVIVPVYNNGRYLLGKCLNSLARNRIWSELEILLVDDGSTDGDTIRICESLRDECPNVQLHSFGDGGSGSASRARNFGISMASASLVTFLDPDNEISPGGYDHLVGLYAQYAASESSRVGLVSGFHAKVSGETSRIGLHSDGVKYVQDMQRDYFSEGRFPVISTQAAVMERDLLLDGGLRFVEGAAGQDTLFGWEVALKAGKVCFTDGAHIVYYSGRVGSVTNTVDVTYFSKSLILEREQVKRLRSHGLLDAYREHHLQRFVQGWYMPQLARVPEAQQTVAKDYLNQILKLYSGGNEGSRINVKEGSS